MLRMNQVERRLMKAVFSRQEAKVAERLRRDYEQQVFHQVLAAFRHAVKKSDAYRTFLKQHGVNHRKIDSIEAFLAEVPTIDKETLFGKYSLDKLFSRFTKTNSGRIWSSSGSSDRLTIGFESANATPNALALDFFLNLFFQTLDRKTLFINTLPDGWPINGRYLHHAHVGTRVDIAIQLLEQLSSDFQQFIVGGEPLLLKNLVEQATAESFNFSKTPLHLVAGGDYVAASYKSYMKTLINPRPAPALPNRLVSVMGMSEFGVATFFETPGVSELQRRALRNGALAKALSGPYRTVPQLFQYDPFTTFVEARRDETGEYRLVMTNLNTHSELPLIRYDTGDLGRVFSHADIIRLLEDLGETAPPFRLPLPIVAATGKPRHVDIEQGGRFSVIEGSELIFSHPTVARHLTGYFRLKGAADGAKTSIALQLKHDTDITAIPGDDIGRLKSAFNEKGISASFESFDAFPGSIGLRYDRKFNYTE